MMSAMVTPVVPSLSELHIMLLDENEGHFVHVDDIVSLLQNHKSKHDIVKSVRKDNIKQELKCYTEGLTERNGRLFCSLTSFYRYCFRHCDGFEFCKKVCIEVTECTLNPKDRNIQLKNDDSFKDNSTLNLYRTLITSDLFNDLAADYTPVSELDVKYFVTDYRDISEFTENGNLAKILLFEEQFQNFVTVTERTNFEKMIKKKWEFLDVCLQMKACGHTCNKMAMVACQKNSARIHAAEVLDSISIEIEGIKHRPECLEQTIVEECQTFLNMDLNELVVCLDCTSKCEHDRGVHVYIGWKEPIEQWKLQEVTFLVMSAIEKRHYLNVVQVSFLASDLLTVTENNIMRRYALRDSMKYYRETPGKVIYVYDNTDIMPITVPEEKILEVQYCAYCYNSISENIRKPLQLDVFGLVQEWKRSVPLPIQAFLISAFINKVALRKKADDTDFPIYKIASIVLYLGRTPEYIKQVLHRVCAGSEY